MERQRKYFDYKKLQNGSDIRGVALEGVDGESVNLTREAAANLAVGFVSWLSAKTGKKPEELRVAVGRDPRLSGEALSDAVIGEGFLPMGVKVFDCGLASTPAMFMTTVFPQYACDGAVMITASHLPFNRNGFKYFSKEGGLDKQDIAEIIRVAETVERSEPSGIRGTQEETANIQPADAESVISEESANAHRMSAELAKAEPTGEEPAVTAAVPGESGDLEVTGVVAARVEGVETQAIAAGSVGGRQCNPEKVDLLETYATFLREMIKTGVDHETTFEKPLTGLKIAVDAGNGAGGFYADKVLAPLGADISGSRFLDPDGHFPNHAPNPEDKAAMKAISQAVLDSKSDFGLIFDTDVDRASAVDRMGRPINRNGIVAMAASLIAEDHPGTTVVTDSVTSDQLTVFLEKNLGLSHRRFRRGYKNVINEAIRLNKEGIDSQLAIETSGHAAFKENYFLDDGAYLATKIVIKAAKLHLQGKTLDSILEGLEEPKESMELRLPLRVAEFSEYADGILQELEDVVQKGGVPGINPVVPNYEGVRISFGMEEGDGWCLLRKSLHDPIMPLNIESNEKGGCKRIAGWLLEFLQRYEGLDTSSLNDTYGFSSLSAPRTDMLKICHEKFL